MLARTHRGMKTLAAALTCVLAAGACGGAQRGGRKGARPIDALREEAEDRPGDKGVAVELALGEHLYDGGDPERARRAVERAKALAEGDPQLALRVLFLEAEQRVLEGEPERALDAYLRLLARAPTSPDNSPADRRAPCSRWSTLTRHRRHRKRV